MQDGLQLAQPLRLFLCQLSHRNLGPAGNDIGNFTFADSQLSGRFFFLPFFPDFLDPFALLLLTLLDVSGLLICLVLNGLFLLDFQFINILRQALDLCRLHICGQADFGSRFIDQVNGLIRKETVVDVAGGKADRCYQGLIGNGHLMMLLIFWTQSL